MRYVPLLVLVVFWMLWSAAFITQQRRNRGQSAVAKAPAARWGIILQILAISVALQHRFDHPGDWLIAPGWRLVAEIVFGVIAVALGASAVAALGKHWRYDAALIAGHQLVESGPYSIVRHPIYTSMFALLLATGVAVSGWPQFAGSVVLFAAGTEIRVREEERLLGAHFGSEFASYRARVPAYIPFVR